MSLLLAILVISSLMLIPSQSPSIIGTEVLVVGMALLALFAGTRQWELREEREGNAAVTLAHTVLFAVAVLPYLIAGGLLISGKVNAGIYFVAVAIVASFVKAMLDAWVLLVEINR